MLAASAALHGVVLLALLVTLPRQKPLEEPLPPPAVAVIFQGGAPEAPSQPNPTPNRSDNAKPAPAPTPEQPPAPDPSAATSSPPPDASPAPTPQVTTPPPEEAPQAEASPPLQTQPPPAQAQAIPEQPPPPAPEPARQSEALLQPQASPPPLEPQQQAPSTPPPLPTPPSNVPPRVELYLPRPPVETPPLEAPEPLPPTPPRAAPPRPRPQPRNEFTPTFRQWALGRPPPQTGAFGPPLQGPSREAPQIRGAERLGADWANELSAWVAAHKYYPQQAILNGEDGSPEVDVTVRRDGTVLAVDLDTRSGSQWLDLALQALFRGAHLPPFPDGTGTQELTFHFTMHYILIRR